MIKFNKAQAGTEIVRDGAVIGHIRKSASGRFVVSLVAGVRPKGSWASPARWADERTLKLAKQVAVSILAD